LEVFGETSAYDVCADQRHSPELHSDCARNFETARTLILSAKYDLVILDELNIVLFYDFLSAEDVLSVLREKPERTEVVITGRYAPEWLIDAADLVTEMREIKHPSSNGVRARKGIEY
jgi:cob(I)alamin adenosyltransferase